MLLVAFYDLDGVVKHIFGPVDQLDCDMVVEAAMKRFGRLDILVNNAGRGRKYVSSAFFAEPARFWEIAPQTWRMIADTNVNGPFLMARSAAPVMVKAGWGPIVNVSMNRETMRRHGFSPYGPSKAALESETMIWSRDLEDTGVTVNALLPGGTTLTGRIPDDVPAEARSALLDPAIMVPPLLWLVSPGFGRNDRSQAGGGSGRPDSADFEVRVPLS